MRTDLDFRHTVTTLTFCGAGVVLTPLLAWIVQLLAHRPASLEQIALGILALLFVITVGLAMTVSLHQIRAHVADIDVSASGGDDEPAVKP